MTTLGQPVASTFIAGFRRITSSGQFIPEIDGLRFFAIFFVFIYHLAGDVLRHSPPGYSASLQSNWLLLTTQVLNVGVPLFFVISGCILSMPFAAAYAGQKRRVSLKKYFLRRLTRLEPPYIFSLLLFAGLKFIAKRGDAAELWPHLLASALYVHNIIYGAPSIINVVAWSLEVEIQFYILAPVIALVFAVRSDVRRRTILALSVLLASSISARMDVGGIVGHSILAYGQYFLAGFLLTEWIQSSKKACADWKLDALALCATAALLFSLVRLPNGVAWSAPWLILLIYVGTFRGVAVNRVVVNPFIATVGGMCYTIYLLHNYIIAAAGMITERLLSTAPFELRLLLQFLLISPIVLVLSGLYFRVVEQPCMRPKWPSELRNAVLRRLRREAYAAEA